MQIDPVDSCRFFHCLSHRIFFALPKKSNTTTTRCNAICIFLFNVQLVLVHDLHREWFISPFLTAALNSTDSTSAAACSLPACVRVARTNWKQFVLSLANILFEINNGRKGENYYYLLFYMLFLHLCLERVKAYVFFLERKWKLLIYHFLLVFCANTNKLGRAKQ